MHHHCITTQESTEACNRPAGAKVPSRGSDITSLQLTSKPLSNTRC